MTHSHACGTRLVLVLSVMASIVGAAPARAQSAPRPVSPPPASQQDTGGVKLAPPPATPLPVGVRAQPASSARLAPSLLTTASVSPSVAPVAPSQVAPHVAVPVVQLPGRPVPPPPVAAQTAASQALMSAAVIPGASPPAGATARCKDGSYLTSAPSPSQCANNGGLAVRFPSRAQAPAPPVRRQ